MNYLIDMHDRGRRKGCSINMLREYLPSPAVSTSYWSESGTDVDEDDEIPVWKEKRCYYGPQLTEQQRTDLDSLMSEFAQVLANTPGRTQFAEHCIKTGSAHPVRLPAYRIPHAYRETVQQEIEEMLEEGIIEHSNSEWRVPP